MEYNIVDMQDKELLKAEIEAMLLDGWDLVGGITIYVTEQSQVHYVQAMTKVV